MSKIKNLYVKNRLAFYMLIISATFLIFTLVHDKPKISIQTVNENQLTQMEKTLKENQELKNRLAKLEPSTPVKMVASDSIIPAEKTHSPLMIMEEGIQVPFEEIYQDTAWVRPDYQPYWHSINGQWSNVPDRIHNSYHRLFATQGSPVLWNETLHNCGIAELAGDIELPVYSNKATDTVAIISVNHMITNIIVYNNQVILVGTPERSGIQVLAVDLRDLVLSVSGEVMALNKNKKFVFQLVTPDGYEIDYNNVTISF
ncbi:hypothetical protein [Phosphitispora sp. TUW77]|uniref:hypothetical protein n=1 Tax=Phosphitispora sp. TUW77 TaxID=3152361 RepID=UPI003AB2C24A